MDIADRRQFSAIFAKWFRSGSGSYLVALAGIAAAGTLNSYLKVDLGLIHPFVFFYPVIVVLALWSSLRAALFATGAAALFADYYLLKPFHSLAVDETRDRVALLMFMVVAAGISVIGDQFRRRAQRLQEFEKAIEGVQEMIVVLDRNCRHLIANEAFLKYRGIRREDLLGKTVAEVVDPGIFESVIKPKLDECLLGKIVQFEAKYPNPREGDRALAVSYFPIEGLNGVDRIAVVMQDVTDKKRMEEDLRRSQEQYRQFVARSSEGIFREEIVEPIPVDLAEDEIVARIRRDSYVTECNDALAKMYGFESASEMIGRRLGDMLVADDPGNLEVMRDFVRAGFRIVERCSHEVDRYGKVKIFRNSLSGIVEDGYLVRTWGIQSDVTEQMRLQEAHQSAQQAVEEREAHFRLLVEQAPDGIFIANADGRYTDVNSAGAEMLGYTPKEVLELSISDIVVSDDVARITPEVERFDGGNIVRSEWTFRRKDGSKFPGEVVGRRLPDGRLQGIVRDLTERRRAEEEMRCNEERFRVALKGSPIAVFSLDRDLRFTWAYNMHICKPEEALGKTDVDIFGAKKAARIVQLKQSVLDKGTAIREEVSLPLNGKDHPFDMTLEPLFDSEHNVVGITGASVDIAQLREMADRLIEAKERLIREKSYLENEIQNELGFDEIIGRSASLMAVLKDAKVVAPTDSTVLLLGETGTGKELVARSLHSLSGRSDKNFVKLNCAAVPSGLLESELFGHEKGAFTGAVSQKVGRIELADKGTLFLDEIGEMPLELQPKLLRVLQDREFERLGGVQTLRVDVRIIAATNRDLRQEANDKKFRDDLFYRLNVFPLELPPLRDRRGDITILVEHFVQKHAGKMGKHIDIIPYETLEILESWNWPGNIRELENVIERMVIMTKGRVLAPPPAELEGARVADESLTEMEREHIIRVLRETNGVLSGAAGAANRLGLKRTTLQSMLKRFNIQLHEFRRGGNGAYGA